MDETSKIARNWSLVSFLTFLSRIFGYLRDVVVAYYFGASYQTDAFYVAYRIPNLLRRLFAEGSITVAFIPVFTNYLKNDNAEAKNALNSIFSSLFYILIIVSLLGVIFSPYLIKLFALGFDKETFDLAVKLNRIMFPYILFISLAALAMGVLNSIGHFFAPAFSPVLFNLITIGSVIFFHSYFKQPILSLALGVIAGGVFQLLINFPFLKIASFMFAFSKRIFHPAVKTLGILVAPQLFGVAVYNINILVNTQFASFMPPGTVTYLFFSERLVEFPLGVIAVSIATVMLPKLSTDAALKNVDEFKSSYIYFLRLMLLIMVPALIGLIVLRVPLCNVLFQRGEFTYPAALNTAQALLGYSLGICAVGGIRVTVPAFYALKDTKTPVYIAFMAFFINILFGYTLGFSLSLNHFGLALASSISSIFNFLLLFYLLNKRVKDLVSRNLILYFGKILLASILMGTLTWKIISYGNWTEAELTSKKIILLCGSVTSSIIIYFLLSKFLKISEVNFLFNLFYRKKI